MYYVIETATTGIALNKKPLGFVKGLHHSKWKASDQRDQLEQGKVKGSVMSYVILSVTEGNKRFDLRA